MPASTLPTVNETNMFAVAVCSGFLGLLLFTKCSLELGRLSAEPSKGNRIQHLIRSKPMHSNRLENNV
jgi:hypothetical protein